MAAIEGKCWTALGDTLILDCCIPLIPYYKFQVQESLFTYGLLIGGAVLEALAGGRKKFSFIFGFFGQFKG